MKRCIMFKYIDQNLRWHLTVQFNSGHFIFCKLNRLLYYDQGSCTYFSHFKTCRHYTFCCLIRKTFILSVFIKRINIAKQVFLSEFFKRTTQFRLKHHYSRNSQYVDRLRRQIQNRMHLKNPCQKNKSPQHNNSSKKHPRFCILDPKHDLIHDYGNDQYFDHIFNMDVRKIHSICIIV